MATNLRENQLNFILKSKVALTNVETQPEIAKEMGELSYDAAKIAEGKSLAAAAEKSLGEQTKEKNEETAASKTFKNDKARIETLYKNHRKKAQFAMMDDPNALNELKLNVGTSTLYSRWRDEVHNFYTVVSGNENYTKLLTASKVNPKELEEMKTLLPQMDAAYSTYYRESGESQEATRKKNLALGALEEYMRRFWRAADIALEDVPQLKEALMKGVK